MKALMWKYNGERLVYADLEYTKDGFKDKNGRQISESCIADIVRDTRKNYVICASCGEMVKNTPQALEAHWKEKAAQKNCLTCNHLQEDWRKKELKRTYKQDSDNPSRYISTYKYSVQLNCGYHGNINDESVVADYCTFLMCKNASKREIDDFFTRYPHAFSTIITVDALIEKKWVHDYSLGDAIVYHHPKMTTLKAVVSQKGIVCEFLLTPNGNEVCYSEKYDKLFFKNRSRYTDRNIHNISEPRLTSYTEKIKELFN